MEGGKSFSKTVQRSSPVKTWILQMDTTMVGVQGGNIHLVHSMGAIASVSQLQGIENLPKKGSMETGYTM